MLNMLLDGFLFGFQNFSTVTISTTFVFIGLLSGREISMAIRKTGERSIYKAIILSLVDFGKVTFGFIVSCIVGVGANKALYNNIFKNQKNSN